MPSYMTLAVIALTASTASPALSAPVQYDSLHPHLRFWASLTRSILLGKFGGRHGVSVTRAVP